MKLLYHTVEAKLYPYPRADDEAIEGLSPEFLPVTVLQEVEPVYDPETQVIQATEVVDTQAATVTRGWTVSVRVLSPEELLAVRRVQMAAAFDALSIPVQAAFYATRIAAEAAMDRGNVVVARHIIEGQAVPPELEATKAAILALFPEVP